MIIFENSGELDPRLITTIGVNVKPSGTSPIGYFGTGLKYALAVMARLGERIEIQSGQATFRFAKEEVEIRGKTFELVRMYGGAGPPLDLAFTTELGKNWLPWMVYRELWCNMADESGRLYESDRVPRPEAGITRVIVEGKEIQAAHEQRQEFILGSKPLAVMEELEIHPGPGARIFYRGIAVRPLTHPSAFTYNIKSTLYLTEDRTAGGWATDPVIARSWLRHESESRISEALKGQFEKELDWDASCVVPSEEWKRAAHVVMNSSPSAVGPSLIRRLAPTVEHKVCPTCGQRVEEDEKIPF